MQAHEEFLSSLVTRALLDESTLEMRNQLRTVYDRILEYQNLLDKLYLDCVMEVDTVFFMYSWLPFKIDGLIFFSNKSNFLSFVSFARCHLCLFVGGSKT